MKKIAKYNYKLSKSIYKLYKCQKYEEAEKYLREYLKIYPNDIRTKKILIKVLIAKEEYEEAEELTKDLNELYHDRIDVMILLILIYMKQSQYEKADLICEDILNRQSNLLKPKDEAYLMHIKKVLNFMLNKKYELKDNETYSIKQMYIQDKYEAIKHIYNHHNKDLELKNIEELTKIYDIVKNEIENNAQKSLLFDIVDTYDFHIEKIGKDKDGYYNVLRVITVINTPIIITMYPVKRTSNMIINEIFEENEYKSGKIRKRKSQIDKFYDKYNLNKYR